MNHDDEERADSRQRGKVVHTHERVRSLPNRADCAVCCCRCKRTKDRAHNGDSALGGRHLWRWKDASLNSYAGNHGFDAGRQYQRIRAFGEQEGRSGNEQHACECDETGSSFLDSKGFLSTRVGKKF